MKPASEDCGSSTGLATIAPSQMQFLHSQSRSCGSGAAGTSVSTQSKQHSHVAQALSTLEAGSCWQPKQLSGQVNKLTIRSSATRGDLIPLRIALGRHRGNVSHRTARVLGFLMPRSNVNQILAGDRPPMNHCFIRGIRTFR